MIGKSFGHYEILDLLGKGGMGEVYLAEDRRLGRKVAVKFLTRELGEEREALLRFRNEARAAAELSHPNIATIHDIGEIEGRPFIVLEYLEGQTLQERIQQSPLSIEESLKIGEALAAALTEAHSHGIIHRDIKSANIMLTPKGEVKILDFGLAHRIDQTQLTKPGTTLGTICYMSPEQARGEGVDPRSDLWSVGVVLYECLTGRLPFTGDGQAVIEQIQSLDPEPPTALRTGIPVEFEHTVRRCLQKDPDHRFQHADDLLASLTAMRSGSWSSGARAAAAQDSGRTTSDAPPFWRSPRFRIAAAVLLLVAAGMLSRSWWEGSSPEPPARQDYTVAVIDVQGGSDVKGAELGTAVTSLVQGGLIESSPCRVLTLEYLKDIRERVLGSEAGPIRGEDALRIARAAGASSLVVAELISLDDELTLSWRLMDAEGEALGAGRCRSNALFAIVDSTLAGILPVLSASCGAEGISQVSVSSITTESEEAYHHFTRGVEERWRDHTKARAELEQAVALDSTFALAWFELAKVYGGRRSWGSREGGRLGCEAGERAWTLRSRLGIMDRMLLEGWLARDCRGDIPGGIETYQEICERWPDSREPYLNLAKMLMWYHTNDEAVTTAEEGLRRFPEDRELMNVLGLALYGVGRSEEALVIYQELAERDPEDASPWSMIGDCRLALGQPDEAEAAYRRMSRIEESPEGELDLLLARCDAQRGEVDRSMERLKALRAADFPGDTQHAALTFLHSLYAARGQREAALSALSELYEGRDFLASAGLDLMFVRFVYDDHSISRQIEQSFRQILEEDRQDQKEIGTVEREYDAHTRILISGLILDSLSLVMEALPYIEEHIEEARASNAYTWWNLSSGVRMAGRAEDALKYLQRSRSISTFPFHGFFDIQQRVELVRLHAELEQYDEALLGLDELQRLFAWYYPALYERGIVQEQMGDLDEAEKSYQAFLDSWAEADEGTKPLIDARERVASIRNRP